VSAAQGRNEAPLLLCQPTAPYCVVWSAVPCYLSFLSLFGPQYPVALDRRAAGPCTSTDRTGLQQGEG